METQPVISNVQPHYNQRILRLFAWTLMLLASDLPEIIWYSFYADIPAWRWLKIGMLAVGLALCWLWPMLRPLRAYAGIFLIFYLADAASKWVGALPWWQSRFTGPQVTFFTGHLGIYILDVGLALVVLAALWLIWRQRSAFFLVKGQLDAPIEPVRWLGIGAGESWRAFGWIFTGVAAVIIALPTFLGMQLSPGSFARVLPLLPAAVLFAAINAFTEEIYFRTSFLSTLHEIIGKSHALLLSCVFFGLGHYLYGSPPGLIGALLPGFLGWLIGKSMLETKGFVWPWFIHFVPDAVIFVSYALGWVQ